MGELSISPSVGFKVPSLASESSPNVPASMSVSEIVPSTRLKNGGIETDRCDRKPSCVLLRVLEGSIDCDIGLHSFDSDHLALPSLARFSDILSISSNGGVLR